ncbi:MAG: hypothetical protein ABIP93_15215 [Gemmatimonadaceae bacterium]
MPLSAARVRPFAIAVGALLAACAGDDVRDHVHRSTPPARPAPPPASVPSVATKPPLGAGGPSAEIISIRLASSGAPVSLDHITDTVNVLALVTRGAGSSSLGPARLELVLHGPQNMTLIEWSATPVPLVIAHEFRVPVSNGWEGLPTGLYLAQVRLVGPTGWLIAQSTPVTWKVRGH